MKKGISLALIGKDEAEGLERLLNSCEKYIDEIILITTAKSKELEYVAKKHKAKIYSYKWINDFSDARNFSFSKATREVVFWCDLDDIVLHAEKLPELAKQIYEGRVDWISLPYIYEKDEYGRIRARHEKPRLTRNGTGKWNKTVHECFEPTKAINHLVSKDVIIDHLQKDNHRIESAKRNLDILLAEYEKDGEKTDARTIYYIGQTYYSMEDYQNAMEYLIEFTQKTGWDEEKYFALHYLTECLCIFKKYDVAIDVSFRAMRLFPQWALAYFDLSRIYSLQGKHDKVIEWSIVGFEKEKPVTMNLINDLEYELLPLGRLADAYLMTGKYDMAMDVAKRLYKMWPKDPMVKELYETCKETIAKENFVKYFTYVTDMIARESRSRAIKIFDCLPPVLEEDARIQDMRIKLVPPKNWKDRSIVIYCGRGIGEHWAYPSIFTGIGGSEEAVINMSIQLNKLGYKVTVYNNCGELQGNYDGVEYIPFFHFNLKDNFDTLIAWRTPSLFNFDIRAKRKISWLHDIAYEWQFNDKIIKNTDKFIFLSKWHRNNMPSIPDNKIFISNNGIDPEHFKEKGTKRPYSLFWGASYDRGLLPFLKNIWPIIKKELPDTTLDIFYGWQNIDKEEDLIPELKQLKIELSPLMEQEGITHHGRVGHKELAEFMKIAVCYPYASEFGETNNITSQKCQASGCYVITTSQAGGTPERIKFGKVIRGNNIYSDKILQEKFAREVIGYLKNPKDAPYGIVEGFSWQVTARSWHKGLL